MSNLTDSNNDIEFQPTSADTFESALLRNLLEGRTVVIPDLGFLEVKSFSGRRTVLFKTTGVAETTAVARNLSESDIYNAIVFPLKSKGVTTIKDVGTFRSLARSDGRLQVSFVPASSLRNRLNNNFILPVSVTEQSAGNQSVVTSAPEEAPFIKQSLPEETSFVVETPAFEETPVTAPQPLVAPLAEPTAVFSPAPTRTEQPPEWKDEAAFAKDFGLDSASEKRNPVEEKPITPVFLDDDDFSVPPKREKKTFEPEEDVFPATRNAAYREDKVSQKKHSSTDNDDDIFQEDDEDYRVAQHHRRHKESHTGLWLTFIALLAIIIVIFIVKSQDKANKNEEVQEQAVAPEPEDSTSTNLLTIAEQKYGNRAFWIYIYEANRAVLPSPVNIPKNVELVIPDLSERNINPADEADINKANRFAEYVLKRYYEAPDVATVE